VGRVGNPVVGLRLDIFLAVAIKLRQFFLRFSVPCLKCRDRTAAGKEARPVFGVARLELGEILQEQKELDRIVPRHIQRAENLRQPAQIAEFI
jgi:hypothetical protein